jgi:hypothetical protein
MIHRANDNDTHIVRLALGGTDHATREAQAKLIRRFM